MENLRKYGIGPFSVAVIHGGPGASGEMAPVAKELALVCGILEPLQTSASLEGQLQELLTSLKKHADFPITLIGHSWGAWLSFLFAARYSSFVKKLILIGSGVFEKKYALTIMETRLNRLNEADKLKVHSLKHALNDSNLENKNVAMAQFGKLMAQADSFDPLPFDNEELDVQYEIYQCVWQEAEELRESGKLLEQGKKIQCPVVAIHGDYDSSPPEGIEEPLSKILKDFRFILLNNCGHYPWIERTAKDNFYEIIKNELI
ncbi:MAG: alpha/beta hydrolase [Halobacteriota archaeon]